MQYVSVYPAVNIPDRTKAYNILATPTGENPVFFVADYAWRRPVGRTLSRMRWEGDVDQSEFEHVCRSDLSMICARNTNMIFL